MCCERKLRQEKHRRKSQEEYTREAQGHRDSITRSKGFETNKSRDENNRDHTLKDRSLRRQKMRSRAMPVRRDHTSSSSSRRYHTSIKSKNVHLREQD